MWICSNSTAVISSCLLPEKCVFCQSQQKVAGNSYHLLQFTVIQQQSLAIKLATLASSLSHGAKSKAHQRTIFAHESSSQVNLHLFSSLCAVMPLNICIALHTFRMESWSTECGTFYSGDSRHLILIFETMTVIFPCRQDQTNSHQPRNGLTQHR